eukprot:g1714.t1
MIREKLIEAGWRDGVAKQCREVLKRKGVKETSVDDLVRAVTPKARASVPGDRKREDASDSMAECKSLLTFLLKHKESAPFRDPVDWKAWKLFDYPKLIKHPMDLHSIETKLNAGQYDSILDFAKDCRLVWSNCKTYNQDESEYYKLASKFSKIFEQRFGKIVALDKDLSDIKGPTVEQKTAFSRNIFNISPEALGNVVTILDERCEKCIDKEDADEIEINIDLIDALTFQAVDSYVKEEIAKQGAATKATD